MRLVSNRAGSRPFQQLYAFLGQTRDSHGLDTHVERSTPRRLAALSASLSVHYSRGTQHS